MTANSQRRVLLAKPRGYCAGVDRAVQTVEIALEKYGAPIYVRKQIVHNVHVVKTLEERGAIFVDETEEVPEGSIVVFSAHGVAPVVHEEAKGLDLRTIDATCPLVTKVHKEAVRFAAQDYDILLIGHEGHEEVIGTTGEAPDHIHLVDYAEQIDPAWLEGVTTVGVTSGASVPDELVQEVLAWLAERGFGEAEEIESVQERMRFSLPKELRKDLRITPV
jgi:4-hydroxy-3-methylbut-2-enyl diphosphate reductase IspH